MQRGLLLNADDFGRHSLINGAVEKGVAEGCLRSASLMPGEPCFSEAVALAKKYPQLGVGIHFTLVDGNPVSPNYGGYTQDYFETIVKGSGDYLRVKEVEK